MLHFKLFGYRVSLRVRRVRTFTREQLERAGAIVRGPDIEAQMHADAEREMREFEVMQALYERVRDGVETWIGDVQVLGANVEANERWLVCKRLLGSLYDLRDIAGRMGERGIWWTVFRSWGRYGSVPTTRRACSACTARERSRRSNRSDIPTIAHGRRSCGPWVGRVVREPAGAVGV